jgi:hypothetical protein
MGDLISDGQLIVVPHSVAIKEREYQSFTHKTGVQPTDFRKINEKSYRYHPLLAFQSSSLFIISGGLLRVRVT